MEFTDAHFVGRGGGTALSISENILRLDNDELVDLFSSEREILAHMNEQHGESVRNMAVNILKGKDGPWQLTCIDPEGCDFRTRKERRRLSLSSSIATADEARHMLVSLSKEARNQSG